LPAELGKLLKNDRGGLRSRSICWKMTAAVHGPRSLKKVTGGHLWRSRSFKKSDRGHFFGGPGHLWRKHLFFFKCFFRLTHLLS
jgi:hypothetical protein